MIHHSKSLELEITEFKFFRDRAPSTETIPSLFSNSKYVEITKFLVIPMYDTSLERSSLGDYSF